MNDDSTIRRKRPRRALEHRVHLLPRDHAHVNVSDSAEIAYWCAHFRCTGSELRAAVATVGTSVKAIAACLDRAGARRTIASFY